MAMGLPTIGTNWGGQATFMNATNSLLVELDGLEDPDKPNGPALRIDPREARTQPRCARPSWRHAAARMRWAFENRAAARAIGAVGREHIVRYFSREAVAQIVVDRVAAIKQLLDGRSVLA
jgi:hypothetical protein